MTDVNFGPLGSFRPRAWGMRIAAIGLFLFAAACSSTPDEERMGRVAPPAASDTSRSMTAQRLETGSRAAPGTPEHFEETVKDRVFFALNNYSLDDAARQVIQRQAAWLRSYPNQKILVEGHCDERGTREYNLALGARRANAVRDYMITLGVDPSRIETVTYGKERPAVPGSDERSYLLNRRAVTKIRSFTGS